MADHPDHPYARLAPEPLREALEWFRGLVPGLRYAGDPGRNMLLPTAVGAVRPTALAPASIAAGDLRGGGPPGRGRACARSRTSTRGWSRRT